VGNVSLGGDTGAGRALHHTHDDCVARPCFAHEFTPVDDPLEAAGASVLAVSQCTSLGVIQIPLKAFGHEEAELVAAHDPSGPIGHIHRALHAAGLGRRHRQPARHQPACRLSKPCKRVTTCSPSASPRPARSRHHGARWNRLCPRRPAACPSTQDGRDAVQTRVTVNRDMETVNRPFKTLELVKVLYITHNRVW